MSKLFGKFTYRRFEPRDLPAVLSLWSEHSNWGAITEHDWNQWFSDTPYGPALATIAENEQGEVVGQGVGLPTRLYLRDREVKGLRLSAPIIRKNLRFCVLPGADHPAIGLMRKGMELAREEDYCLLHAMPRRQFLAFQRWAHLLNFPRFETAEFGCVEKSLESLTDVHRSVSNRHESRHVLRFGPEYDELWNTAKERFPIHGGIVRRSPYLQYRNGGHLVLETRNARDELLGYVALRKDSGLIDDMLAKSMDDLSIIIVATLTHLVRHPDLAARYGIDKVKAMTTRYTQPVLLDLGFERIKFVFGYASHCLDGSVGHSELDPASWYLTPGD